MVYFSAVGLCSALGNGLQETAAHLAQGRSPGMRAREGWLRQGSAMLGRVEGDLPEIPAAFARHHSRNNRLLLAALEQIRPQVDRAISQFGASRVAVVLGTSTSGLDESDRHFSRLFGQEPEQADEPAYHYDQQELGDPSRFLSDYLGLTGPAYTVSTACSSSSRAIISGRRLIASGMVDVAIVGGADTLSRMPVNGFASLELLSPTLCRPFSKQRSGITIGEGASLMLLTREPQPVALLGVGESSDAWHMSAPHPEGAGAIRAMAMALQDAGLNPQDIGYINLHGTATPANDNIEALAVHQLFGDRVACSSVKHLMGHTLGAAGACEVALSWLILTQALALPPQDFSLSAIDDSLPAFGLLLETAPLSKPVIMSNAFAFGGNNTSLILGTPA